ncbi:MAG: MerR family DNA-binding transcriptional regulator [Actinomycetota bacterium]|nr:MerR family DNA-binding transcriptional regulator [Actinomycetota bacterium]
MRALKTSEAAALLNVSSNTLRAWERRFGYPEPQRSAGGHRLYAHGEVAALRDALRQGLSISSAVSRAREALSTDTYPTAPSARTAGLLGMIDDRQATAVHEVSALALLDRDDERREAQA